MAVLLWRAILFIWSYVLTYYFPFTPTFPYFRQLLSNSWLPESIWRWGNFDGVHYLSVARNLYAANFTQAFFPLYPMVVRLIAGVFNDKWMILSGLAVSNLSFLLVIKYLNQLLGLDFETKIVRQSIIWLLLFPFSFFFGAIYSESIFLLLVILAFLTARQRRWWLSGVWGMLAASTRLNGILLWPALVYEYFQSLPKKLSLSQKILKTIKQPVFVFVPLGLIGYMTFLKFKFGDALMFWHAQIAFGAERSSGSIIFPLITLLRYLKIFMTVPWNEPGYFIAVTEFTTLIFGLVLLLYAWKKGVRRSYIIFSGLVILLPTLSGTLSSFPRYLLPAFIIYPVLAQLKNRFWTLILFIFSALLLLFYSSRFINGLWAA